MDRTFKILYWAFIALLVAFGGLLAASYVGVGGLSIKIVQSGSMEPAIKTGAIVVVAPVDDYKVGDVITFNFSRTDQIPTTHRIIDEKVVSGQMRYITKGDANEESDPREVLERNVLGKVFLDVPYLGYLLDFARKPLGFGLLIGVPAAYIVLEEVLKIVHEVNAVRRQKKKETEGEQENNNENS